MNSPLEQVLKSAVPSAGFPEEKLRTMLRIQIQMEKLDGDIDGGTREEVIEARLLNLIKSLQQTAYNLGQQTVQQQIRKALGL